ncbi:MAG: cysteine hydrolase [Gammaproteobacteria bacterium]|nr:cysteine hydrolase [Gammaproteobacteria bacterium]
MQDLALIIIDMQKGMASVPASERNNLFAEENIQALMTAWRSRDLKIAHVKHISESSRSPFFKGGNGAEFQDSFRPQKNEKVVEKCIPDALTGSSLKQWLGENNIAQLVVVGVSTNNSVESTARTAGNLGFDTIVVSDATFTFPKQDFHGVNRSADEVHAMSLANLKDEYARILTTSDVLFML